MSNRIHLTLELTKEEAIWLAAYTGSAITSGEHPTPNYRIYEALYKAAPELRGLSWREGAFDARALCDGLIRKGLIK